MSNSFVVSQLARAQRLNLYWQHSCFADDGKKCTKIHNARAQLLFYFFCPLNLLFGENVIKWVSTKQ